MRLAALAVTRLREVPGFGTATALATYSAFDGELDPAPATAVAPDGCEVFFPAVTPEGLEFRSADGGLRPGWRGLLEPAGERRVDDRCTTAVILVPGVAFDQRGARLGRGGGHYDRALAALPRAIRVGLAFELQVIEEVPVDPWDQAMHYVVTEARVIVAPAGTTSDEEKRA